MLCLPLRTTQYLRSFKVNATAFSTLNYRKKANESRKQNQFFKKNLRIEYFNSTTNKKSLPETFDFFKHHDA